MCKTAAEAVRFPKIFLIMRRFRDGLFAAVNFDIGNEIVQKDPVDPAFDIGIIPDFPVGKNDFRERIAEPFNVDGDLWFFPASVPSPD